MTALVELVERLRASRGFAHKRDIGDAVGALARAMPRGSADLAQAVRLGDDCAALPDEHGGYLLFAIEGLVEDFIACMPWFAGYCSVMVNVSDIAAMGGRPVAVVDALWSDGHDAAADVIAGMAVASNAYGVPIVGGHTNHRSERGQLAVAILGRAKHLLTSFNARPGDALMMAIDLRGAYEEPFSYWNASTRAPAERLRADLDILPILAERRLCDAAKDISMAGAIGTALMLLEGSQVGATIDVDAIPKPPGVDLARWLLSFPSFGFVRSVRPQFEHRVRAQFFARDIACATIGRIDASRRLQLRSGGETVQLWDLDHETFIGARPSTAPIELATS